MVVVVVVVSVGGWAAAAWGGLIGFYMLFARRNRFEIDCQDVR